MIFVLMKAYKEYNEVQKCLRLIEKKLSWGDAEKWHNNVFIELSERIQEETKVLLSPTTLKRVWGRVNYNSAPSISTLNALAQFAGFLNWRDFKNTAGSFKIKSYKEVFSSNFRVIMFSAFIIALLFFSILSMSNNRSIEKPNYSNVIFKSQPITEGLPNSVVFNFDLKGITSENILIQQFWDPSKKIEIQKSQKQATGQYYYPGYFRAKLLVDGEIIREHDLFIKSNGWLGTIDYEPVPKYFKEEEIKKENTLSFSEDVIKEIIEKEKPISSTFHYVNDLDPISGDNFELTADLKSLFTEKWSTCQKTIVVIIGTKSAILIPFSIPGCISEIGLMLSEKYLDGKKNDLSAFGVNLSNFNNIKLKVENKELQVYINEKQTYMDSFIEPIGNVVGVRFKFYGVGEVKNLILKDLKEEHFLGI
ncbi:hypothetical protein [Tenacibaculum amylolyticum]|uniref:hypothetical protein n=1 Tax=Tenacibaculum amylolyticum TaxID=104269 RepID=UPI0038947CFF